MSGPPPKPTALKLVAGNPGKRVIHSGEPDPDYLDDLTPPDHMEVEAAAVWTELAPRLRKARVLTTMDTIALEMLCVAVASYRAATADAARLKDKKQWAALTRQAMFHKQAMTALAKFGMSPADRTRVLINPQGALPLDDPADKFFG